MADIKYIIPFTKAKEGGLSKATTDRASSLKCAAEYGGYHTNKGVTCDTFKTMAPKLGYAATKENFFAMPDSIWLKIAKNGFWDKQYLDQVKSQAVANIMFSWQWGSGYGWRNRMQKYFASKGISWNQNDLQGLPSVLNALTDKYGEKKVFDDIAEQKKEFLLSIPGDANDKGWLNRLDELTTYSYGLMQKGTELAKQNPITTALITAGIIIGAYFVIKSLSTKKT